MTGRTHLLGGLTFGALASCLLTEATPLAVGVTIAASTLGSVLPDLDQTNSLAGKKVRLVSYPIHLLKKLFDWLGRKTKLKLFKRIGRDLAHRGLLHTPLFWLLVCLAVYLGLHPMPVLLPSVLGLLAGIASHLILDTFNPTGIPWFYPISKKIHVGRVITGTKAEKVFYVVLSIFGILATAASVYFHLVYI